MSAVVFTASEALAVLRLAPRTLRAGLQRAEARFTENELHKEVGAGTLTLQAAQAILATDWFNYYLG